MRYLLDTDMLISFLKDEYHVAEKIDRVGIENCYVSEISIAELTYGAYNSEKIQKHLSEVNQIENLFEVLPLFSAIDTFAREKVRLRKEGNLIPDFDLIIGCTAVANNMTMVTNNVKHLESKKNKNRKLERC
ncbi:PIN domain-containing protein [Neolewinella lacunae]|uniref:PIN domain-containing protein n=1 Tax=Neolewinella lacunae TaxID=1517758 RepID=UPI001CA3BCDB|nr:PIN domain-containing protein [Neolewinella lacunae]MDN3635558.1 PIN domain-containing protein [Neolewinella lacunae]